MRAAGSTGGSRAWGNRGQGEGRKRFNQRTRAGAGVLLLHHAPPSRGWRRRSRALCVLGPAPAPCAPARSPSLYPLPSRLLPDLASLGAHPHPPPGPAGAPPPAAACGHWNPCRPGTQLTADRQWYFPSAWVSGAGLIQRCFSISLTPHCPALITEMLMSCLAWKWFLHLGARTASL